VGGFYVNRKIAEFLLSNYLDKSFPKKKLRNSFKLYEDWKNGYNNLADFEEVNHFLVNFHNLIYEIGVAKIALCRNITNWNLDNVPDSAVPISIPATPYEAEGGKIDGKITAREFNAVFIEDIWNRHLKPNISRALSRAKDELKGESISVILLSGGSANIGWLRSLIMKDFYSQLTLQRQL